MEPTREKREDLLLKALFLIRHQHLAISLKDKEELQKELKRIVCILRPQLSGTL